MVIVGDQDDPGGTGQGRKLPPSFYTAVIVPYIAYETIDIVPRRNVVPDVAVLDQSNLASSRETAAAIAPAPMTRLVMMELPTQYQRIEIRALGDESVVTVIEILSPVNKRPGIDAADAYERKRRPIFPGPRQSPATGVAGTDSSIVGGDQLSTIRGNPFNPWQSVCYFSL